MAKSQKQPEVMTTTARPGTGRMVAVQHGRDNRIDGPIGDAYGRYDSDLRVNGIDGFGAFADAVELLFQPNGGSQ